jgi:transposase
MTIAAGYRVYRQEIDEKNKTLDLWVRRKRGNRKLECSGCGRKFSDAHDCRERAVRDLPWSEFRTAVHIEVYRVKCPDCGVKVEKVPLLPSKAPLSKRFENAVGQACESASTKPAWASSNRSNAKAATSRQAGSLGTPRNDRPTTTNCPTTLFAALAAAGD